MWRKTVKVAIKTKNRAHLSEEQTQNARMIIRFYRDTVKMNTKQASIYFSVIYSIVHRWWVYGCVPAKENYAMLCKRYEEDKDKTELALPVVVTRPGRNAF